MSRGKNSYCRQCDKTINPTNTSGHYQQVVGFMKLRPRGGNEIALKRTRPVFICKDCMGLMKAGMNPAQSHLFDV